MPNYELEHDVQNKIRIWCGEQNWLSFRINVGKGYTPDGRYFSTGVPEGFPDLIVCDDKGHTIYVETKTVVGRLRKKQKQLHAELRRRGHVVLVPRTLEQFIEEIKEVI